MGGDADDPDVAQADMNGTSGSKGGKGEAAKVRHAIQDPPDYFNRLTSQDNLFKIVERRYTAKARQLGSTRSSLSTSITSIQPG